MSTNVNILFCHIKQKSSKYCNYLAFSVFGLKMIEMIFIFSDLTV